MPSISKKNILRYKNGAQASQEDLLATEEPLEIRLAYRLDGVLHQKSISVTMRTPGHDEALALGFLFTEGIIDHFGQVKKIGNVAVRQKQARGNVVVVELAERLALNFKKLERHFYTSSSCGVCGKSSIEAVFTQSKFELTDCQPIVPAGILCNLPGILLERQPLFDRTGGLHAAALFDAGGRLLFSMEDVGRHNALDKLIGEALKTLPLPLSEHVLLVSGRAGFELVQKAVMAGIPIMAALGAPSDLAVQLAVETGMTLAGFLKKDGFNVYAHGERIIFPA